MIGGSTQQEFMGMAMGQAAKLWESQQQSGNVSSDASKESVVQQAGGDGVQDVFEV